MIEKRPKKIVLFDCMETLIDMYKIPGDKEYARWAYEGSLAENIWNDFEEFLNVYVHVRELLRAQPPANKEYDIREIYQTLLSMKFKSKDLVDYVRIIDDILTKFWQKYVRECFVSSDVRNVLSDLADRNYTLGVVSNFIVRNGVEELLGKLGISDYFKTVITSVNVGWRKPHPNIYNEALKSLNATSKESIFIGDDYMNDYIRPKELGFNAYLYDRSGMYKDISDRFDSFAQLTDLIDTLNI